MIHEFFTEVNLINDNQWVNEKMWKDSIIAARIKKNNSLFSLYYFNVYLGIALLPESV